MSSLSDTENIGRVSSSGNTVSQHSVITYLSLKHCYRVINEACEEYLGLTGSVHVFMKIAYSVVIGLIFLEFSENRDTVVGCFSVFCAGTAIAFTRCKGIVSHIPVEEHLALTRIVTHECAVNLNIIVDCIATEGYLVSGVCF